MEAFRLALGAAFADLELRLFRQNRCCWFLVVAHYAANTTALMLLSRSSTCCQVMVSFWLESMAATNECSSQKRPFLHLFAPGHSANQSMVQQFTRDGNIRNLVRKASPTGEKARITCTHAWKLSGESTLCNKIYRAR
eukprot:348081-Amphidinium_carterae.1